MKYLILSIAVFLSACSNVKQESLRDAIIAQTFCSSLGLELERFYTENVNGNRSNKQGYHVNATCSSDVFISIPVKPNVKKDSV